MHQTAERLRLLLETGQRTTVGTGADQHRFERHHAVERQLPCAVHRPHATVPEMREQLVSGHQSRGVEQMLDDFGLRGRQHSVRDGFRSRWSHPRARTAFGGDLRVDEALPRRGLPKRGRSRRVVGRHCDPPAAAAEPAFVAAGLVPSNWANSAFTEGRSARDFPTYAKPIAPSGSTIYVAALKGPSGARANPPP